VKYSQPPVQTSPRRILLWGAEGSGVHQSYRRSRGQVNTLYGNTERHISVSWQFQFRSFVGMLLFNELRTQRVEDNKMICFPIDIQFFLSNVFLLGLSQGDLQTVKDYSFIFVISPCNLRCCK
jgi:hypothetical protein